MLPRPCVGVSLRVSPPLVPRIYLNSIVLVHSITYGSIELTREQVHVHGTEHQQVQGHGAIQGPRHARGIIRRRKSMASNNRMQ